MKTVTAKEAKNRFGKLLDAALAQPVTVEKHGRPVIVVLSFEEYKKLAGKRTKSRTSGVVRVGAE
jgi:prevent-host-death family protein